MELRFAARVAAAALSLYLCACTAQADTLVVGGHRVASAAPFVLVDDEIFAPLLPALKHLDAGYGVTPDAICITTTKGATVIISRRRPEATVDGILHELPGPPRIENGVTLLPARAVGSMLGCAVRWEEASRTIYLYPWVREFSLTRLPDRYRLTVGAEAPISYQSGQLDNPPRLFLDLKNLDLADIPSSVRVEDSYLLLARIGQHSLAPSPEGEVTRLVVELSEWKPYRIRESEDRRRLEIEFPLPDADELPPDAPPVVLSGLSFRRLAPGLAEVALDVSGICYSTSGARDGPPAVWVQIANADNRIAEPRLSVTDKLVSAISIYAPEDHPGSQILMVSLSEATGHAIVTDERRLRLLLGRTELANLSVVIDPGHGGHDAGAIGRSGLREKDVNLDIALRTYRRLQALGARVRLTRMDDNPLRPWRKGNRAEHRRELLARCELADALKADLFVSVHANARESNPLQYRGTETYYRKADSARFAGVMQQELVRALQLPDGGVKRHPSPIIVLYRTAMPAVLVEIGYLSNPADEALLATSALRDRAAIGIVNGIKRYAAEGGLLPRAADRLRQAGERR